MNDFTPINVADLGKKVITHVVLPPKPPLYFDRNKFVAMLEFPCHFLEIHKLGPDTETIFVVDNLTPEKEQLIAENWNLYWTEAFEKEERNRQETEKNVCDWVKNGVVNQSLLELRASADEPLIGFLDHAAESLKNATAYKNEGDNEMASLCFEDATDSLAIAKLLVDGNNADARVRFFSLDTYARDGISRASVDALRNIDVI